LGLRNTVLLAAHKATQQAAHTTKGSTALVSSQQIVGVHAFALRFVRSMGTDVWFVPTALRVCLASKRISPPWPPQRRKLDFLLSTFRKKTLNKQTFHRNKLHHRSLAHSRCAMWLPRNANVHALEEKRFEEKRVEMSPGWCGGLTLNTKFWHCEKSI